LLPGDISWWAAHGAPPWLSPSSAQILMKTITSMVIFQVLMAASIKMTVLWDAVPCSVVEVYQYFRGACCLSHYPNDGGSKCLWNVSKLLPDYMVQHPRKQSSSITSTLKEKTVPAQANNRNLYPLLCKLDWSNLHQICFKLSKSLSILTY
jgi:hypothetical protein